MNSTNNQNIQRKIGLVLGSGGARGLAHIGVIKKLEENNVPIDYIAGSSIGAIVGAFYAAKKDIAGIEQFVQSVDWRKIIELLDPVWRSGLLHGEKIQTMVRDFIGNVKFEDLKIPLSVVATDYKTGEPVIFNSGEVAEAVRASMSVPLAFKPAKVGDSILMDGGLSLPVPVEVAKKMGAEVTIAVNLDGDYFNRSDELSQSFPNVAINAMNILRYHLANYTMLPADVILTPAVGDIMWYDFLNSKHAVQAGEESALQAMAKIKKLI